MDRAFLVQYQLPSSDENIVVGIYSSEAAARAAIDRVKEQPGFRDYPDFFLVEPYELDTDQWSEGFVPPRRREIPLWGCLGFIFVVGVLVYVAISGEWIALPFVLGYGLFFFGVAALAKWKADRTDFSSR